LTSSGIETKRAELLTPRLKVGLLGGSFNPAHEGHLHLTRMCIKALGLDRVWWLVSPQNPLKPERDMAPFAARLAGARALVAKTGDPRIAVTAIEARLGTRYTVDTLTALKLRHPDIRFVWLMGADNMLGLRRWRYWRRLVGAMPIAVYPRPGFTLKARLSPAAAMLRPVTLDAGDAPLLSGLKPPALVFLEGREHAASATAIRSAAGRRR
jgi:nicotinate-nucleotide adenylyltransferase